MSVNFNGLYIIKGLGEFDFGRKEERKEGQMEEKVGGYRKGIYKQ